MKIFKCLLRPAIALFIAAPVCAAAALNPELDEVTVLGQHEGRDLDLKNETASRLGLSNRETPAIVDVLTQTDFQTQGLNNAIDALNAAPGVFAGNVPGGIGLGAIRGFTRGTNYQYDGMRMSTPGTELRNWDSWSFERVEVLKGPSSIVAGDGALAGTVNFVPKKPKLSELGGEALLSFGSYDSLRAAGDVNVPLTDTLAARANVVWSKSKGWVNDTDSSTLAINGAVLWKPSERASLILSFDRFSDEFDTGYFGTTLVPRSLAQDPSNAATGPGNLVLDRATRKVNYNFSDGDVSSTSTWVRARADYAISAAWSVRNDLSIFGGDRRWINSEDYTFNSTTQLIDRSTALITHDQNVISDRFNASYDGLIAGRRNRFTMGAEATATDFATSRRFGTGTSVDRFNPVRGLFPTPDTPANFATRQEVTADVDDVAAFIENAYNLTPELLLVGGIRHDHIKLQRRIQNVTSGAVTAYGNTYDPLTWRAGVVYSLSPKTQVFAQYSKAVVPVSGLLFISAGNATFNLTKGESVEGGLKSTLADDRVQLTISAFHIRQDDILTRNPTNPAVTIQGGSQTSDGIETSISANLTPALRLELGASLLNAKFLQLIEAGNLNRSGNLPPNVPETLLDATATWAPIGLPFTLTGSIRHTGRFFSSNANDVRIRASTLVDAGINWQTSVVDVTLRGRNLTNRTYVDFSGFLGTQMYIGEPRSFELTLKKSF
jgi:iron complex outermembrane recepter protein